MPRPETPLLTVDIIIELVGDSARPVVLIERRYPPHGWAIPGGFVDVGERVEDAAIREAYEETGLEVRLKSLLGVYSDPKRDDRGHTASVVFVAEASGHPTAGDDAASAQVFELSELPGSLVFDHSLIMNDYRAFRREGIRPPLRSCSE